MTNNLRVIAIDRFPERLRMAQDHGAEKVNYQEVDSVYDCSDRNDRRART